MVGSVVVTCPKCKDQAIVWVVGRWDVKDVTHTCGEGYKITFDPPRPVY